MTYQLDKNAKAFSYTRKDLFDCITRIVAHPHTAITQHDQSRALAIMLVFEDYFSNFTESDNDGGHYVYERDELDFQDFVIEKLGLEYYHYIGADEVLK